MSVGRSDLRSNSTFMNILGKGLLKRQLYHLDAKCKRNSRREYNTFFLNWCKIWSSIMTDEIRQEVLRIF